MTEEERENLLTDLERDVVDLERAVASLKARSRSLARINWWLARCMGVNGVVLILAALMPPHPHEWLDLWCVLLGSVMLGLAARDIYREGR